MAITLGDPAGVGPEVIVRAWSDPQVHESARPIVLGSPEVLRRAVQLVKSDVAIVEVDAPEEAKPSTQMLPCIPVGGEAADRVPPGIVSAGGGQAAYDALVAATDLALAGRVDGITTAPLSKAALWQAGHHYPGHTELLAALCGIDDVAMMLYLPPGERVRSPAGLGVVHVTLHTALASVFAQITPEVILARCRMADDVLRRMGCDRPRIAVCALNPHAGEDGLFGNEEATHIRPGVDRAADEGLAVSGPWPTDSLMVRAAEGEFDAVVAMYHDQGHIALKLLGMHRAVNVTLGLPLVRTSVAHGTALDRAWTAAANPGGMVSAIAVASRLIQCRDRGVRPVAPV